MPFVKLSPSIYVNTDHIVAITGSHIDLSNGGYLSTNGSALAYLLACIEPLAFMSEKPIEQPSLKSRIAQALRYDFPGGIKHHDLVRHIIGIRVNDEYLPAEAAELEDAITALHAERVLVQVGNMFYHADNDPTKSSPDPSTSNANNW